LGKLNIHMRVIHSFDRLLNEAGLIWEQAGEAPWPSEAPIDEGDRNQLLKKIKKEVEKARFRITKQTPTIGMFLQQLKTLLTWDVKTMAVDDKGNIYINPTFCDFLSSDEVKGVLIHEAMHIITKTFFRKGKRNHRLWNICTDYLMNYYIVKEGYSLPKGGCIPDSNGDVHFEDFTGKKHVFNIINKTAEWLYAQLERLPQPPPQSGEPGEPGEQGEPTPIDPQTGTPLRPTDDDAPPTNADIEEGSKTPNTEPMTVDEINRKIQTAVRTANQNTHERQSSKGRGTGEGSGLEDITLKETESKTDYGDLLKNLAQNIDHRFNWRRMSRRGYAVGSWIPKIETDIRLAKITIAIDTSGSISSDMISQILAECINITQMYPGIVLEILKWHTKVYYHVEVDTSTENNEINNILSRANEFGGTDLGSVAKFYRKNTDLEEPGAILYFTDGFVEPDPDVLDIENFFLIVPGGSDHVLKNNKNGVTYNISV